MGFLIYTAVLIVVIAGCLVYAARINKYWKMQLAEKTKLVKDAEAQLIHMEKMASLGTLAAGVAHEINNPLGFLISNLQSLKDSVSALRQKVVSQAKEDQLLLDDFQAMTQESLEGAQRIKKIVSDLRTFSRRSETQKVAINVNQLLESVLAIVWNEIKYKVTVVKDYQATSTILGDPTQLSQVILNLLINASQAIAEKGSISVSSHEDEQRVFVRVTDTGSGIPKEVLTKIFDPFFSTKKSTGLGLSVSYNIIKHHGGEMNVESAVGKGTTFILALPKGA